MGNKNAKKEMPLWAQTGHSRPITRREMLASGVIPFSAWAIGPSLMSLLSQESMAADLASCSAAGASSTNNVAVITLSLSGGPSLASNVVVKNLAGANLANYNLIGGGTAGPNGGANGYTVIKDFANQAEFPSTSRFYQGMAFPQGGTVKSTALAKSAFVWSAARSNDDSSGNPLDITGWVLKMGVEGTNFKNLGISNTATGINQQPATLAPPAPFIVNNVNALSSALGYTSLTSLSGRQKLALANAVSRLSSSQVKSLGQVSGAVATQGLVDCAGLKNADLLTPGKGGGINPFAAGSADLATMSTIWGVTAATPNLSSQGAIFGALVYNAITGSAATANLNLGGYDYHNGTRTTGDNQDQLAGGVVGRILQTAEYLKKPVFIYVCADGSTVSNGNTANAIWTSDRGIAGMQYMIAYDPVKAPTVTSNQLGGFNAAQAADDTFVTGSNVTASALSIFANYAAFTGNAAFLDKFNILGDAATRAKVIKFTPRV